MLWLVGRVYGTMIQFHGNIALYKESNKEFHQLTPFLETGFGATALTVTTCPLLIPAAIPDLATAILGD